MSAFYEKQKALYDLYDNRRSKDDTERALANLQNAIAGASFNEPAMPTKNGSTLADFLPKNEFGAVTPNFKFASPAVQDQSGPNLETPKNALTKAELASINTGSKIDILPYNMYGRMATLFEATGDNIGKYTNPEAVDKGYNPLDTGKFSARHLYNRNGDATKISNSTLETMKQIKSKLLSNGISSNFADAMIAHFYREHSKDFNDMWLTDSKQTHIDYRNKKENSGAISYQGIRKKLYDQEYAKWKANPNGRSKMDFELEFFLKHDMQSSKYKNQLLYLNNNNGSIDDIMSVLDNHIGWEGASYDTKKDHQSLKRKALHRTKMNNVLTALRGI